MHRLRNIFGIGFICLIVVSLKMPLQAFTIGEAANAITNRLEVKQLKGDANGVYAGSWPGEADFTGSIVAGIAGTYEMTWKSDYKSSAELGGDYILLWSQGSFYGDEAFALTRLSQIATDPCNNNWRTAVASFYNNVKKSSGSTNGYISNFQLYYEPSTAVLYMANYVIAAYYVNAVDKQIWRKGLIDWLSKVDDSSDFPVLAMGVATWALAQTGPMDKTLINPSANNSSYWYMVKLSDIPNLLLSNQVSIGRPGEGSFYWQFKHTGNDPNGYGYTEDAIFGTLGLTAIAKADPNHDPRIDSAILAARESLLNGISPDGRVWWQLSQKGAFYNVYSGEMLQVLRDLSIPGDINLDGVVDLLDLEILLNNYPASNCSEKFGWCNGADLNRNGKIDYNDFYIMIDNWLKGTKS
jgi:hypothetical protein